jgi:lipopolysaccharide heptosyltransferase II
MENPQRILLIQLKRAGDVLLTTPVATAVKSRWPSARLDFLVDKPFASLLENHPAIDTVRPYDRNSTWRTWSEIRAQKYDIVFDFQSSPRSALTVLASGAKKTAGYRVPFWGHVFSQAMRRPGDEKTVVQGKLSLVATLSGPLPETPATRLQLTAEEQQQAQVFRRGSSQKTVIGLVPTHRRASRRWLGSSFAVLAQRLNASGYACWVFWGPGEKDVAEAIQRQVPEARLIPDSSLRQMAGLFSCCDLVVTNDNGPMHLAVAVGAPTITLYGPTNPGAWNPGGSRHTIVQASNVTCLGCNLNECPFDHECMKGISPDAVFEKCQDFLGQDTRICSAR